MLGHTAQQVCRQRALVGVCCEDGVVAKGFEGFEAALIVHLAVEFCEGEWKGAHVVEINVYPAIMPQHKVLERINALNGVFVAVICA